MPEKERKVTDWKLKEEIDTFLDFGLKMSVDNLEETVKTAADKDKKKKGGAVPGRPSSTSLHQD